VWHSDAAGKFELVPRNFARALEVDRFGSELLDVRTGTAPDGEQGLLCRRCLADDSCARSYDAQLAALRTVLDNADTATFIDDVATVLAPFLDDDTRRTPSALDTEAAQDDVRTFLTTRRTQLDSVTAARRDDP
jgi:hypothetical protein